MRGRQRQSGTAFPLSRAALLQILLTGVPIILVYGVIALWPLARTGRPILLLVNVLVSVSFFATGALIATDDGHRATAIGLWLAAVLWPLNWVNEWGIGPLPLAAALLGPLASLPAVWALLRYPQPWPHRRDERWVIVSLAVLQTISILPVLTSKPAWHEYPAQQTWLSLWPNWTAFRFTTGLYNSGGIALAAVTAVLVIARLTRLSGPDRRQMRPVLLAIPLACASTVIADLASFFHTPSGQEEVLYQVEALTLAFIPLSFLAAALLRWLARESVTHLIRDLGSSPTPEQVQSAVAERLGEPELALLYRAPVDHVNVYGHPTAPPPPGDPRRLAAMAAAGFPDGILLIGDPALNRHPKLLASVLRVASLTLENTRLQAVERARMSLLERSEQRLREAVEIERDRTQSAVGTVVSQHLDVIGQQLASLNIGEDEPALRNDIDAAVRDLAAAKKQLLLLATGAIPELLTNEGLAVALAAVDNRVNIAIPPYRWDRSVENAAYFAVCELIANGAKHAPGATISVHGSLDDDDLVLEIADDGNGGADLSGSGLRGIAQRLSEQGGVITLDSPPGGGTTATIRLPICERDRTVPGPGSGPPESRHL